MTWTKIDIKSEAIRAEVQDICSKVEASNEQPHLRNNLGWVRNNLGNREPSAFLLKEEDNYLGFALVFKQDRPLPFQFGEVKFFHKKMVRYELWSAPVYSNDLLEEKAKYAYSKSFLVEAAANLQPSEALSIEAVEINGNLYDLLTKDPEITSNFLFLYTGSPFAHQYINMPKTFEEYLGVLGSKSRRSIKYRQRKLSKDFDGDVETISYDNIDKIEPYLDAAIAVSKTTYQWHLLGLGLRDREVLRKKITYAANQGWFRSYVLFIKGKPVAFMLGFQYADCYYYEDVGFDPEWSKWGVGSILQMNVMEELYSRDDKPSKFDFSTGYGKHKAQFGNASRDEVNMLLLPKTWTNIITVRLFKINESISEFVINVLDRIGLKRALKRMVRMYAGNR